jgi:hypothetical protein
MVIPPETFAGDDLLRIEMANFEVSTRERQRLKARFSQSTELTLQSGNNLSDNANGGVPGDDVTAREGPSTVIDVNTVASSLVQSQSPTAVTPTVLEGARA